MTTAARVKRATTQLLSVSTLQLHGRRYAVIPETVLKSVRELLEDAYDNTVCDARVREKSIPAKEFFRRW